MAIKKTKYQISKEGLVNTLSYILEAGGHYLTTQDLKGRGPILYANNMRADMYSLGVINAFGDLKETFKAAEMAELLVSYRRETAKAHRIDREKRIKEGMVLRPAKKN